MCKVNSIRLQISVVFALNAESSCFPSQLLCLLSSFLLNIVSVGVVATDFFIVMTFLGPGLCLSQDCSKHPEVASGSGQPRVSEHS